jgi:hypothetical protein
LKNSPQYREQKNPVRRERPQLTTAQLKRRALFLCFASLVPLALYQWTKGVDNVGSTFDLVVLIAAGCLAVIGTVLFYVLLHMP